MRSEPPATTPEADPADRALVEAFLRRRDESSFRLLYRRHTPLLYALARRLGGGRTGDAEEVVQETWIRAAAALPRFRWESKLTTWLCGIAIRCARELQRAPERNIAAPEAAAPERPDARLDLERALAQLAPGYREVVLLHDLYGYTHEEIAGLLGVDAGTSKSQLSRARRVLREELEAGESPLRAGRS